KVIALKKEVINPTSVEVLPEDTNTSTLDSEYNDELNIPGFISADGYHLEKLNNKERDTFFDVLIRYIYDTTKIDHVTYQDKKYYNRTNSWYDRPKGVSTEHDPNYVCGG